MLTVGSLFSGIGGFDLGLERAGFEIKWQVENNAYCRRVLAKHWPTVSCYGNITTIDWRTVEPVDLVCGGFPCQPFSVAGKQRGKHDDRYLWPEVVRCLDALRPTWFLGENVPGIINLALDQVCTDLEGLGYTVWPVCLPACAVDAPHIRQRVWILAHDGCNAPRTSEGMGRDASQRSEGSLDSANGSEDVADAENADWWRANEQNNIRRRDQEIGRCGIENGGVQYWLPEPTMGRVADGVPSRVDRLKGLGNAVVPQVVEALGRMILESERQMAPP